MRLSISNIAWDVSEDDRVAAILREMGFSAIDIAPGKYFPDPHTTTASDIAEVRRWWERRGVEIIGMQSLLFGTQGLNLFGPAQDMMLERLGAVLKIAKGLNATRLTFGSPKNRDRTGITDGEALRVAVDFFRRLGDLVGCDGTKICLEPKPPAYGCNFMIDSEETATVVRATGHPSISMQFDSGASYLNEEDVALVFERNKSIIEHCHASEPHLSPLGTGQVNHHEVASSIPSDVAARVAVCVEMLPDKSRHEASLRNALAAAAAAYIKA